MRIRLVPDNINIDFFRYMRFWLAVSILGVIGSFVSIAVIGLNYGVDFRGGTLIMAATPDDHDVGEFRTLLDGLNVGEVGVTTASDTSGQGRNVVLMRLGVTGEDATDQRAVIARVQAALTGAFPGISYLQVDTVGAKVSDELVRDGVLAVLLSVFGIMIYIWLRFEWQFGLGAAASLLHDAIVVVGMFSLFQLEFDLTIVAAVLTVVGFSINDTVVVFDRVREVLRKYKRMPLRDVLNLAFNETLSRTVMTVMTTMLALIAILIFGGPTVRGFSIAVIFGILIGTYSSIYVASAVVLWLGIKRDWDGTKGDVPARATPALRRAGLTMRVTEIHYPGSPPIDGYGPGFFRIGGAVHQGALLLLPEGVAHWGGFTDIDPILEQSGSIDVLLVGMGAEIRALPADARARLEGAGIGVEIMATPAACRTYNVLLGEGRRVALALIPV